jgi:redox-sensitive bicupin YhaK (pirin superfamily)
MGPDASLAGRRIGMDFEGKDGWRMYHGDKVPGFPQHPHRGFETVTLARRGFIDHSDSLGAAARFGSGDVQWMTAGSGIVHSEMFPLVHRDKDNPVELFQIWLNLPKADKLVEPHFTMLWHQDIPSIEFKDAGGPSARVTVIAGSLNDQSAPAPPPHSWASKPESDVAIWTIELDPGASFVVPRATGEQTLRALYFFVGERLSVAAQEFRSPTLVTLDGANEVKLTAGDGKVECLLLQGRPLEEPVAHHGPFVMNTREELEQAIRDYRQTQFGGWPWPSDAPVHPRERQRFARHADGRVEEAP